jgi:hypothetical protein
MELKPEEILLLEAYFRGELPAEERQILEKRLQAEPEYARAAHQVFQTFSGLKQLRQRQQALEMIKAWDAEKPQALPRARLSFRTWMSMAAGILLLGLLGWFLLPRFKATPKDENDRLFAEFFSPYDYYGVTLCENPERLAQLYQEDRNYQEAAPAFRAAFVQAPQDSLALLYACVSEIAMGQAKQAIPDLTKLARSPSYMDPAAWYLALAYLQLKNQDATKAQLNFIIEQELKQTSKAQNLLQKISD